MKTDLLTRCVSNTATLGGFSWLADHPLLHLTVHGVGHDGPGGVLVGEVGMVGVGAVHEGDLPLDGQGDGVTLLPGHVPAVVFIPGPDLLPLHHLPETGAVLPGHVPTLVVGLVVLLLLQLLQAGGKSLEEGCRSRLRDLLPGPVH